MPGWARNVLQGSKLAIGGGMVSRIRWLRSRISDPDHCHARRDHEMQPDRGLEQPLSAAVDFLARIQPPDGWFGGEWASRNTHNYFAHGLEVCGRWLPQALAVNTSAVAGLIEAEPCYSDDHILGHHCWSYLLAARNWVEPRAQCGFMPTAESSFRTRASWSTAKAAAHFSVP